MVGKFLLGVVAGGLVAALAACGGSGGDSASADVASLAAADSADTQTVLIVRHATAGRKSRYKGDDRKRPLDKHGRAQAESLVWLLLAFGATDLHAADRVRCRQQCLGRRIGCGRPQLVGIAIGDEEAPRQLGVDRNFVAGVELLNERPLDF